MNKKLAYIVPFFSTYSLTNKDHFYNNLFDDIINKIRSVGGYNIKTDKLNINSYWMSPDNCVDPLTDPSFINKIPLNEVFRDAFLKDTLISSAYSLGGLLLYVAGKLMESKKKNVDGLDKEELNLIIKKEKLGEFFKNFGMVNGLAGSVISGLNLGIIYNNPVKIEGINALYYAVEHPEYANGTIIPYEISFWINLGIGSGLAFIRFGELLKRVRGPKVDNYKGLAEVLKRVG